MTMQLKPTFAQLLPLLAALEWRPTGQRRYGAKHNGWTFEINTIALSAEESRSGRGYVWRGEDVRELAFDVREHLEGTAPDWTALYATDDDKIKAELLSVAVECLGEGAGAHAEDTFDGLIEAGEQPLSAALRSMFIVASTIAGVPR